MAILELLSFQTFISFINGLRFWHHNLSIWSNCAFCRRPVYLIVKFPKLDYPVVRAKHLDQALFVIHKFNWIDFLVKFDRFQMVKFWLVTLNFSIISVVKVPRIFQFNVLKNYYTTAFVSYGKVFSGFVKWNSREYIIFGNILLISFAKAVNIHPI